MIDEKKLIKRLQDCVAASDNSNFTNGLLSAIDIICQQPNECTPTAYDVGQVTERLEKENINWIPCTERLPEEYKDYLVTINGTEEATILTYSEYEYWRDENGEIYSVVAWQPVPETYKGER